ncbi:inheritance of peroxisomes protein 1-domain-containing protein [Echria macrotheca]|uniref:Inheritance of peroxisomes protein 1 n=1 Tax=Echria macrotheca TaxID=438768 RepID=A0AAJ0F9V7_9PEZI|nr:inheritance of peroxisomes protein 1-domain-containing protein [Echria macrotheca]
MEFSRPPGSMPAPRRVFTAPVQSSAAHNSSSSKAADGSVDTLYDHPSVKIVSFTAGSRPTSFGPRTGIPAPDIEPGTLSWSSQLERTIAVGPFRIYRAPGSVAFLSCGSALQPILPKSQVWCVDESSSKFVLQIRRPQYWRIEIPVAEPEDARRALLLREVFDKILQFEKTECPFKRTFTVELPEPPSTPVKKRPWTPVRRPGPTLPPTPGTPVDRPRILNRGVDGPHSRPESPVSIISRKPSIDSALESSGSSPHEEATGEAPAEDAQEPDAHQGEDASPVVHPEGPSHSNVARLSGFYASRCVTAPPQLMLAQKEARGPIDPVEEEPVEEQAQEPLEEETEPQSPAESLDEFHSPQSFRSAPLPPSPPLSEHTSPVASPRAQNSEQGEEAPHQEDASDITVLSNASHEWSVSPTTTDASEASDCATAPSSVCDVEPLNCVDEEHPQEPSSPTTPLHEDTTPLHEDASSIHEDGPLKPSTSSLSLSSASTTTSRSRRPQIRHRATASSSISPSRRALSPLPPAANLFSPRPAFRAAQTSAALTAVKRLPMAVIHKTCEILMSPPSHLVNLMLKVAARIAAGEWRGLIFGMGEQGEQIPVQWDWSEDEDDMRGAREEEDWPPRRRGTRKMAGSFPESDDEESISGDCHREYDETRDEDWSQNMGVD